MSGGRSDLDQIQVGGRQLHPSELELAQSPKDPVQIGVMYGSPAAPASVSQLSLVGFSKPTLKRLHVTPADPAELFSPLIPSAESLNRLEQVSTRRTAAFISSLVGWIGSSAGGLAGIALLFHPASLPLGIGMIAAGAVLTPALSYNMTRAGRVQDRDVELADSLASKRFAQWIAARHQIEVKEDDLSDALKQLILLGFAEGKASAKFKAANGVEYLLVGDNGSFHVERFIPKQKKRKAKRQLENLDLKPLAKSSEFSSEASVLIEQIGNLIAKLRVQPLSPEQQHVTKRAQEDVLGLAALNSRLHGLDGPSEADEQHFATTLLTLRDELRQVLTQQHAVLSAEVAVTATYVKERRGVLNPSLELEK